MARKILVRTRHIIDKAPEEDEYRKTVGILKHGLMLQTEHSIDEVLDSVRKRMRNAFAKSDDGDEDDDLTGRERNILLEIVKEQTDPLDSFIDAGALAAFYVWAYNLGGKNFLKSLGVPLLFDLYDKHILAMIQKRTELLIKGLDETTRQFIADRIAEGIESGAAQEEIAGSIRDLVPGTYADRAETIVCTEMSRMVNAAQFEAASRNGAMGKLWVTQGADDECADNEDQGTIGMDETFSSGDEMPPAHPNCRCDLDFEILEMGYYWNGS